MKFSREELAMIQDALHDKAVHSTFVSKYQRVAALRDKIQSHLIEDAMPDTKRCPVSA